MAEWKTDRLLHGADYYPEQWLGDEKVLEEDLRLMKKAHISTVTLGVFAWAALEPEENIWNFGWLDERMDRLWENGISFFLATPSGARPAWAASKYPEILRTAQDRRKNLYGMRMNHCYTSPKYRELVERIDRKLAERYGKHPGLLGWHISNEYHGECHCPLCQEAFRKWLKRKYQSLDRLNAAWWTSFWAKTYSSWEQIESPSVIGEQAVSGLALDWKRFVTWQTRDFMETEIRTVRSFCPDIPVTTNMLGTFPETDSPKIAEKLDVAALDLYPEWGREAEEVIASEAGLEYDAVRSWKRMPFLLMETTPSRTNWAAVGKLKDPGIHLAGCLQAVAHGADSVQYFQWRKSRGAFEKFHGAVIGHCGHEHTRVFREVEETGRMLERLRELAGAECPSQTAILYDWNNRWALEGARGPREEKQFPETILEHYRALRRYGVTVDLADEEQSFGSYRLIAAPMLYLIKPGLKEKLEEFVSSGGTLILTYFSGITDENDLCFTGGFPGPLRALAGIWAEELDTLYPGDIRHLRAPEGNLWGRKGDYQCSWFCERIHLETARAEAVFADGMYEGCPALTRNRYGRGEVWYLAARAEQEFLTDWYGSLLREEKIAPAGEKLPPGLELSFREKAGIRYWFYSNFSGIERTISVPAGTELLKGRPVKGEIFLKPLETAVIREK